MLNYFNRTPRWAEYFVTIDAEGQKVVGVVQDEDIRAATYALVLEDLYSQLLGKEGALMAIPFLTGLKTCMMR
jgi:hypothetical protein